MIIKNRDTKEKMVIRSGKKVWPKKLPRHPSLVAKNKSKKKYV